MLRAFFEPRLGDETAGSGGQRLVGRLRSWTLERRRQRIQRDGFNTLLRVQADVLEDVVGLRRDQVEHAARLPLNVDAAEAVRSMQRQRPGTACGAGRTRHA